MNEIPVRLVLCKPGNEYYQYEDGVCVDAIQSENKLTRRKIEDYRQFGSSIFEKVVFG